MLTIPQFRKIVWNYYRQNGRHTLPWRHTHDPYAILVSEIMLQQTQVDRVLPFYAAWLKKYPSTTALAKAPLAEVLALWQGLGYNRRAKMLHEAAKLVALDYKGVWPRTVEELESLPGIGPYTARAVAAFAFNQRVVFVETNLRTAVLHHFYADKTGIPDSEVLAILKKAYPKASTPQGEPITAREWYAALMDYGAHLKRSGVRINAKSKSYAKQSAFEGSGRQVRGAILRQLVSESSNKRKLQRLFSRERAGQVEQSLSRLVAEGLVEKKGTLFMLPK